MSLFNAPSTILRLIQEFKLSDGEAEGGMPGGDAAGISDVATELASSNPPPTPPQQPGMATMTVPGAPSAPAQQDPTMTKTVINSSIVLANLAALRGAIATAETAFKKGDAGIEDAASALSTLQVQINSISTILGSFIQAAQPNKAPATPAMPPTAPETELPAPEPVPSAPSSPAPATGLPNVGGM